MHHKSFIDQGDLRWEFTPFHASIGWPLPDPELTNRMLLIGYSPDICCECRVCDEVHLNTRRILEFMFSPLAKIASEAFKDQ